MPAFGYLSRWHYPLEWGWACPPGQREAGACDWASVPRGLSPWAVPGEGKTSPSCIVQVHVRLCSHKERNARFSLETHDGLGEETSAGPVLKHPGSGSVCEHADTHASLLPAAGSPTFTALLVPGRVAEGSTDAMRTRFASLCGGHGRGFHLSLRLFLLHGCESRCRRVLEEGLWVGQRWLPLRDRCPQGRGLIAPRGALETPGKNFALLEGPKGLEKAHRVRLRGLGARDSLSGVPTGRSSVCTNPFGARLAEM